MLFTTGNPFDIGLKKEILIEVKKVKKPTTKKLKLKTKKGWGEEVGKEKATTYTSCRQAHLGIHILLVRKSQRLCPQCNHLFLLFQSL